MRAEIVKEELKQAAHPHKAAVLAGFFKTRKGEYGEGDCFLGVSVPEQRLIAKKYASLSGSEVEILLESVIHEHRLTALLILVARFGRSGEAKQKEIVDFYLAHTERVNNWDLVDATASQIVGEWLVHTGASLRILRHLACSPSLWERRIAMVATFAFIKRGRHKECREIAILLLRDPEDLLHKAVGWMLREMGKRSGEHILMDFLDEYAAVMPRTALRAAIERFPETRRKYYRSLKTSPLRA